MNGVRSSELTGLRDDQRLRIGWIAGHGGCDGHLLEALNVATPSRPLQHRLVLPGELTEDSPFDLLVSLSSDARKITSHPTFLADERPRSAYFADEARYSNVCSYDGFLCFGRDGARLFQSFAAAFDKPTVETGRFQRPVAPRAGGPDLAALVAASALRLSVIGTDASPVEAQLLRALNTDGRVLAGGGGHDHAGRLSAHAHAGAGLITLPVDAITEDILPPALLEIVSASAAAICPDTPSIRKVFGENLFYYDPALAPAQAAASVLSLLDEIAGDPGAAQARVRAAQSRLEATFGPAIMLQGLLDHYELWCAAAARRVSEIGSPLIDVIVRVGGRPLEIVTRAIESIDRQTVGRFRVLFCAYAPIDLEPLRTRAWRRINEIKIIDAPSGSRAQTLAAGLANLRAPFFCILDDDDYLLSGHVAGLLRACSRSGDRHQFAYSDVLRCSACSGAPTISLLSEGGAFGAFSQILGRFTSNCFLATSATVREFPFHHWQLRTAEDSLLIASLLRFATPFHSPSASCVYVQETGNADFLADTARAEDELSLFTEIAPSVRQIEQRFPRTASEQRESLEGLAKKASRDGRRRLGQQNGPVQPRMVRLDGSASSPKALMDEAASRLVAGGAGMVALDVDLAERARGGGAAIQFRDAWAVAAAKPLLPWEIFLEVELADLTLKGCSLTAIAVIETSGQDLRAVLQSAAGEAVGVSEFEGAGLLGVSVSALRDDTTASLGLQGGGRPFSSETTLLGVRLLFPEEEAGAALGLSPASTRPVAEALEAYASHQVLNVPEELPRKLRRMSFRGEGSVYARVIEDGPLLDGAVRRLGTGRVAWDYFARIHLPAAELEGVQWLRVRLGHVEEPLSLFLVDALFEKALCPALRVRGKKTAVEAWLPAARPMGEDAYLILQADAAPCDRSVELIALEVGSAEER